MSLTGTSEPAWQIRQLGESSPQVREHLVTIGSPTAGGQKGELMLGTIIGAIVAGLIIGALARLFLPGKQNISILMTIVIGIIASVITSVLLGALFGYTNDNGGVRWWYWIVSIVVAAIGISLYGNARGRKV